MIYSDRECLHSLGNLGRSTVLVSLTGQEQIRKERRAYSILHGKQDTVLLSKTKKGIYKNFYCVKYPWQQHTTSSI